MTHPSLAEELERKTVEELERIVLHMTQRRIDIKQAASSLQSLWNTTAGLVSDGTQDLIAQTSMAVKKQVDAKVRPDELAVFLKDEMVAIVSRVGETVSRRVYKAGISVNSADVSAPDTEAVPTAWAAARHKSVCFAVGTPMEQVV